MKRILIFLVILVAVDNTIGQRNRRPRPIGNQGIRQRSSIPSCPCSGKPGEGSNAVTLNVEGSRPCRGAIVSQNHIIVPASCVYGKKAEKLNIQPYVIEHYTIYDGYCHETGKKNIAVIKVRDTLRGPPACIPIPTDENKSELLSLFTNIGTNFKKEADALKLVQWIKNLLMQRNDRICP